MAFTYPVANFYQLLVNNSNAAPHKSIIVDGKEKLSNSELLRQVEQIAGFLKAQNIQANDKVALVMMNSWQYLAALIAIGAVGAVAVPINNFLKHDELAYILNDSQARLLFASAKFAGEVSGLIGASRVEKIIWFGDEVLENELNFNFNKIMQMKLSAEVSVEVKLDDLALLVYTSGTTGKAKGAMLSYRNLLAIVYGAIRHYKIKQGQAKFICYLPMFHVFTLAVTVLLPLATNSKIIIVRSIASKKDFAKVLRLLLIHRCRYFAGVPDVFSALARTKLPWYFYCLHNVKAWVCGAAPLSSEVIKRFGQTFKRGKLVQGYGLSECASGVTLNQPWANKDGSVGLALPDFSLEAFTEEGQQLKRGEVGELYVKGDCVMLGYYNQKQETQAIMHGEWLKTGDIGYVDEDGFVFIIDRKKDLIIHKGMNVYPREIEEVLYTHPKIQACAVVGIKDKEANEIPVAYIELKEGLLVEEGEIKEFLRARIATFKQARKIYFLAKLPRNASGKILKRELRDLV